jgi:hypothetical protein
MKRTSPPTLVGTATHDLQLEAAPLQQRQRFDEITQTLTLDQPGYG